MKNKKMVRTREEQLVNGFWYYYGCRQVTRDDLEMISKSEVVTGIEVDGETLHEEGVKVHVRFVTGDVMMVYC